jgi:adenosylcobinamide-phosphate synthase
MSLFAIILALLLEQARPLALDNPVHRALQAWAAWVRRSVDAGQGGHAWLAWSLAVLGPTVLSSVLFWLLWSVSGLLAFAWSVAVLYLTLGFRQFSHHFTAVRTALESGDEAAAREALAAWQGAPPSDSGRPELLRRAIALGAVAAHRHVFGVLVLFLCFAALGAGPAGAVLYRLAEFLSRRWSPSPPGPAQASAAGTVAQQAWRLVDLVPVRVTALSFAVVGNFEEALASWRQDAQSGAERGDDGLLLAATAGAINARLTGDASLDAREPQLAHLASLVGLVWRSVLLWLLLLVLLTLAYWAG